MVLNELAKTYATHRGEVKALENLSLQVQDAEFVVVSGPSGSGKTTLLMTIAGMLLPTRGSVLVDGVDIYTTTSQARADFRARTVGFIFQTYHLLPYLNVLENVAIAANAVTRQNQPKSRAEELLRQLELVDRAYHKPSELSAGEKQRAVIARALLNGPKILLADEPTGNLDPDIARTVIGYLSDFNKRGGTIIMATHSPEAAQSADRVITLHHGKIT